METQQSCINEVITEIGGRGCHLLTCGQAPKVVVVKPLGRFEWRCLTQECEILAQLVAVDFVMCAFDVEDMDSFRLPDVAMLAYLTDVLVPELRRQYPEQSMVLGGYSLGGLFALWCSTMTDLFSAVAACSPSLWAEWWPGHAQNHAPKCPWVYLSVGDTEEKTRKQPFCRMGDALRAEYQLLLSQVGAERCVLEWNQGGHFADIEMRKAKGFAWCINHLLESL